MLKDYMRAIETAIVGALALVLIWGAHKMGVDGVRAEWAAEKVATAQAGRTLDTAIANGLDKITAAADTERTKQHAQNDILRADIRAGALRLSIPTVTSAALGTGIRYTETRADIVPAVADRIVTVGLDGDDAVRDLNTCVDKYNAVRDAINAP